MLCQHVSRVYNGIRTILRQNFMLGYRLVLGLEYGFWLEYGIWYGLVRACRKIVLESYIIIPYKRVIEWHVWKVGWNI